MEPRIQTDLFHARARYFLASMMRSEVAFASVIPIVPHERLPCRRVHTQGRPIMQAQPVEARRAAAVPCGQIPVCLQLRKDCLQSTLVTFATSGRIVVVVALILLTIAIPCCLQGLMASSV